MTTIYQLLTTRHQLTSKHPERRAGSMGAWRIVREESDPYVGQEYSLWHHDALMLRWRELGGEVQFIRFIGVGQGSISDQDGMQRAFRALDIQWCYYFCQGQPRIVDYRDGIEIIPDEPLSVGANQI